jgi:V/A-type H+-transporting ATPase subunit I
MLLILLTMILNMINALRRKDFKAAFLDTNGLAGFIFYGAVVTVVALLFAGKTFPG